MKRAAVYSINTRYFANQSPYGSSSNECSVRSPTLFSRRSRSTHCGASPRDTSSSNTSSSNSSSSNRSSSNSSCKTSSCNISSCNISSCNTSSCNTNRSSSNSTSSSARQSRFCSSTSDCSASGRDTNSDSSTRVRRSHCCSSSTSRYSEYSASERDSCSSSNHSCERRSSSRMCNDSFYPSLIRRTKGRNSIYACGNIPIAVYSNNRGRCCCLTSSTCNNSSSIDNSSSSSTSRTSSITSSNSSTTISNSCSSQFQIFTSSSSIISWSLKRKNCGGENGPIWCTSSSSRSKRMLNRTSSSCCCSYRRSKRCLHTNPTCSCSRSSNSSASSSGSSSSSGSNGTSSRSRSSSSSRKSLSSRYYCCCSSSRSSSSSSSSSMCSSSSSGNIIDSSRSECWSNSIHRRRFFNVMMMTMISERNNDSGRPSNTNVHHRKCCSNNRSKHEQRSLFFSTIRDEWRRCRSCRFGSSTNTSDTWGSSHGGGSILYGSIISASAVGGDGGWGRLHTYGLCSVGVEERRRGSVAAAAAAATGQGQKHQPCARKIFDQDVCTEKGKYQQQQQYQQQHPCGSVCEEEKKHKQEVRTEKHQQKQQKHHQQQQHRWQHPWEGNHGYNKDNYRERYSRTTVPNYYKVLGIQRTATLAEIKKAYVALVKSYHPDQNQGEQREAAEKLHEVQRAYAVLKHPTTRSRHDEQLDAEEAGHLPYSIPWEPEYETDEQSEARRERYRRYAAGLRTDIPPSDTLPPALMVGLASAAVFGVARYFSLKSRENSDAGDSLDDVFADADFRGEPLVRAFFNPFAATWERLPDGFDPPLPLTLLKHLQEDVVFSIAAGRPSNEAFASLHVITYYKKQYPDMYFDNAALPRNQLTVVKVPKSQTQPAKLLVEKRTGALVWEARLRRRAVSPASSSGGAAASSAAAASTATDDAAGLAASGATYDAAGIAASAVPFDGPSFTTPFLVAQRVAAAVTPAAVASATAAPASAAGDLCPAAGITRAGTDGLPVAGEVTGEKKASLSAVPSAAAGGTTTPVPPCMTASSSSTLTTLGKGGAAAYVAGGGSRESTPSRRVAGECPGQEASAAAELSKT